MPSMNGAADLSLKVPTLPDADVRPENQAAYDAYREKQEANMVIERHLSQMRMALDPLSAIQLRLTAMMDILCPPKTSEGEAMQIAVEDKFQELLTHVLSEMRRQAVSAQLQAGAHVPTEMLEAMHRAQGGKPVNKIPKGFGG